MSTTNFAGLKELFSVREASICQALGLNRDEVRDLRTQNLKKGADWELVKNRVAYTPAALETLKKILALPPSPPTNPPPGTVAEAPEAPEELVDLVLYRVRNNNTKILVGHLPHLEPTPGNWVYIRVRDNSRYRRGMTLQCRHLNGSVFAHVGRVPRAPVGRTSNPNQQPP